MFAKTLLGFGGFFAVHAFWTRQVSRIGRNHSLPVALFHSHSLSAVRRGWICACADFLHFGFCGFRDHRNLHLPNQGIVK